MWGKKDMARKGSQNRTNQCKMRGGQRRNIEDEGIRSRCGASHGTHEIEGVWAKGIQGFERLGKKRGKGGKSADG